MGDPGNISGTMGTNHWESIKCNKPTYNKNIPSTIDNTSELKFFNVVITNPFLTNILSNDILIYQNTKLGISFQT